MILASRHLGPTLFPYTTLFRSRPGGTRQTGDDVAVVVNHRIVQPELLQFPCQQLAEVALLRGARIGLRSEEHTSELQSHSDLVCRLLLEKKKIQKPKKPDPARM